MGEGHDVFVSYRRADSEPVTALVAALRERGVRVWQDTSEIPDFVSATQAARDGIAGAGALLAYYSATYPLSRPCQWELVEGYVAAQRHGKPSLRVLVINPEGNPDHIEPLDLRDARYIDATGGFDWIPEAAERIALHVGGLGEPLAAGTAGSGRWIPAQATSAPRFVGRARDLWRVHSALAAPDVAMTQGTAGPGVAVVRGMGGAGKTLLAQEYALRFGSAYPGGVFSLRAHGNEALGGEFGPEEREAERRSQMRSVAAAVLGSDSWARLVDAQPEEIDAIVRSRIAQGEQCLWLVDDVPPDVQADELERWIGPAPARTLFTTRSGEYERFVNVPLGMLEPDEALALLTSRHVPADAPEVTAAEDIVRELGGHPLAIDVASSAVKWQSFSELRDGLRDLSADELEMAARLRDQLPTGHERSISATLLRSIRNLTASGLELLHIAAELASDPIPDWLVRGVVARGENLDERAARWRCVQALDELAAASLADRFGEEAWIVHPLVSRTVLLTAGDVDLRREFREALIEALTARIGFDPGMRSEVVDLATRARLAPVLSHARHLVRTVDTEAAAELAGLVAQYDMGEGSLESAEALRRRQLEANRGLLGERHPESLRSMTFLAAVLQARGVFGEALDLEHEALEGFRGQVGEDDPRTLATRHRIALLLNNVGRVSDAITQLEVVYRDRARALGPESPDALDSALLLAHWRAMRGELATAHALAAAVLDARGRTLGEGHQDTLVAMDTLANVLLAEGKVRDSVELHGQALRLRIDTLGDESPVTLDSMHDFARALIQSDLPGGEHLTLARELNERVLTERTRLLGEAAPKTLSSANNLADVMRRQGDVQSALELDEVTLALEERVHGADHPETLTTRNNLAVDYYNAGDLARASTLLGEVLDARLRILGADDPVTIETMASLGAIVGQLGDIRRAVELCEQAVSNAKRVLGPRHPMTRSSFGNLMWALSQVQDRSIARAVIARVAPNGPAEFGG